MSNSPLNWIAVFFQRRNWRGSTWIHSHLCAGERLQTLTKHGVSMDLDPREYIDKHIIVSGYYEEEVLEAVLRYLPDDGVFWDIGANLGLHGLTVKRLRSRATVFAFEPNPELAKLIDDIAGKNGLPLIISEVALDASEGRAEFFIHSGNVGRSSLHNWDADPTLKSIQVTLDTGDNFLTNHPKAFPSVIKIDVEGNELRVFQGMLKALSSRDLKAIVFEDSPGPSEVKELLSSNGYAIEPLSRREDTHHNLENFVATRMA